MNNSSRFRCIRLQIGHIKCSNNNAFILFVAVDDNDNGGDEGNVVVVDDDDDDNVNNDDCLFNYKFISDNFYSFSFLILNNNNYNE